jgi:hypothetical protein
MDQPHQGICELDAGAACAVDGSVDAKTLPANRTNVKITIDRNKNLNNRFDLFTPFSSLSLFKNPV